MSKSQDLWEILCLQKNCWIYEEEKPFDLILGMYSLEETPKTINTANTYKKIFLVRLIPILND